MGYRGELGEHYGNIVNEKVPEAVSIHQRALRLDPARFAMVFGPGTNRDEIAACLQDAASFLAEARYALAEAHAQWLWHTEVAEPADPISARFWSQFYLDDAILRMYSTAETVAAFAELHLDVRSMKQRLPKKAREGIRGQSRVIRLSKLLDKVGSVGDLQANIAAIATDASWLFVTDYRDRWVHEQRPRLEGLGLSYQRRKRWQQDQQDSKGNTWVLGIGGGDPPDLTAEKFFEKTDVAYRLLRGLVEQCCRELENELSKRAPRFPHRVEAVLDDESDPPRTKGKRIVPQEIDSSVRD
jgi:hypothetical protein